MSEVGIGSMAIDVLPSFGEDRKMVMKVKETPTNSLNVSSSCAKMIEILGEKEKKKKPLRFIMKTHIIVATIMEEICKMHTKLEKNPLDFL